MTNSPTDIGAVPQTPATAVVVPRAATIEGFVAASSATDGINLGDLAPLTALVVRTCNSHYRIVISCRTAIYVQGGRFFPEATDARLEGSSLGGSFLKMGWIGIGLCMEICARGQRIVTSPVLSIARETIERPH